MDEEANADDGKVEGEKQSCEGEGRHGGVERAGG